MTRLLDHRRDREHDVREVGDRAFAKLQADDEGPASIAASAASGSGRSAGSTPPISSAPSSPPAAAARMPVVSRPTASGRSETFHAVAVCSRADASATGRPPGSRFGSAPASRAPRSPARRGTQPSRAPVAAANLLAAERAPGDVASRSPTRMTAPGWFSSSSSVRPSSAAASPPGAVRISLRTSWSGHGWRTARWRVPARRSCGRPCAAAGRRSGTPLPVRNRRAVPRAPSPGRCR